MNYYFAFVKKPAMKWHMVFDLPSSQRQIKYYTLRVLCDLSEAGGEYNSIKVSIRVPNKSTFSLMMDRFKIWLIFHRRAAKGAEVNSLLLPVKRTESNKDYPEI